MRVGIWTAVAAAAFLGSLMCLAFALAFSPASNQPTSTTQTCTTETEG